MWKKPELKAPNFDNTSMREMTENELQEVNGGSVGTCYVLGYTCWSTGGLKIGTCLVIGYACNTSKGSF